MSGCEFNPRLDPSLVVFDHEILIMKYFHRPGHSPADSRRAIVSYKPKYVHTSTGLSPLF